MLVEIGNTSPVQCAVSDAGEHVHTDVDRDAPSVTYINIDDSYTAEPADVRDVALHLARNPDITNLPGQEAFLVVAHSRDGAWSHHGSDTPSWVWSDNTDLQQLLAEFYGCTAGQPENKEDTHYTTFGPPGVGAWAGPATPTALKVNSGNDIQSRALGGGQVGSTGQATASSATSLTNSGAAWTTNQWAGARVFATVSATQMVFGNIISNTATVLTVDQWYTVATPGGAAGSTPSSTATYVITDGNGPAWFMGLTANSSAAVATDTSLAGEITTAGGGLVRKICPYAHTAGVASYTLTPVFTANGSDSLPVTIAKIGVFTSMVVSDTTSTMMFETLLNSTATLSSSGDQLTITETISE
jgi:hypothetical protein